MTDQVPEVLEFESLKPHEESDKVENILRLEDPPIVESDIKSDKEYILDEKPSYHEEIAEPGDLLNLHEPPKEDKDLDNSSNNISDEVISQFAQNLIDPIVKEAIEIQKAEMEDSISDEVKVDSCGDKKSEKSLSDDGFEYLKADDINQISGIDQNSEELNRVLDNDSLNKTIEDDSFVHEDIKLDSSFNTLNESPSNENDNLIIEDEIPQQSILPDKLELETPEGNDEAYDFDLQDIIAEYEANIPESEKVPISEPVVTDSVAKEFSEKEETVEEIAVDDHLKEVNEPHIESIKSESSESPLIISENNICQKLKDIFCWKDPIMSSIVLSIIMLIELGLIFDYSIISLLAYSGLILLFISFFYKIAVKFNIVRKCTQSNCSLSISSDDIELCVNCVLKWIEYIFNEIKSLTYVVSFTKNLKAFTFFWILTYVGQWFNLLSLIFMGTVILFSFPIIYTTYKETIDQVTNKVRDQIKDSIKNLKLKSQQLLGRRA